MKIKPGMEQEYQQFTDVNSKDAYSRAVICYAERWGDMMESAIADGATVAKAAADTERAADIEGLTGFQYGCAVSVLAQFWSHGEELRQWHNHNFSYEGQGTVNPAILTFGE